MSALENDHLGLQWVEVEPEETTRLRRDTEQLIGRKLPPGPAEIAAYERACLEPPKE
ncbi:hypothetical protein [Nocardia sp. NPDC060249]|uniref:hypothetical protein n=1 Tax=Nocardia sp. NPDC060249 TaxID=3347082 RepID=UPI0036505336